MANRLYFLLTNGRFGPTSQCPISTWIKGIVGQRIKVPYSSCQGLKMELLPVTFAKEKRSHQPQQLTAQSYPPLTLWVQWCRMQLHPVTPSRPVEVFFMKAPCSAMVLLILHVLSPLGLVLLLFHHPLTHSTYSSPPPIPKILTDGQHWTTGWCTPLYWDSVLTGTGLGMTAFLLWECALWHNELNVFS